MLLSLKDKRKKVDDASALAQAACALDKHTSLKAKKDCKKLILSTKGLAVMFISGAIKGAMSEQSMDGADVGKLVGKRALSAWLLGGS